MPHEAPQVILGIFFFAHTLFDLFDLYNFVIFEMFLLVFSLCFCCLHGCRRGTYDLGS